MPKDEIPFPVWVSDALTSPRCQAMDAAEFGAYFRLMFFQWLASSDVVPGDVDDLRSLANWRDGFDTAGSTFDRVLECFRQTKRGIRNPKVSEIKRQKAAYRSRLSSAGGRGGRGKKSPFRTYGPVLLEFYRAANGSKCCRCGSATESFHHDHIIPIYQGGPDEPWNWQPLCRHCNLAKGSERVDALEPFREEIADRLNSAGMSELAAIVRAGIPEAWQKRGFSQASASMQCEGEGEGEDVQMELGGVRGVSLPPDAPGWLIDLPPGHQRRLLAAADAKKRDLVGLALECDEYWVGKDARRPPLNGPRWYSRMMNWIANVRPPLVNPSGDQPKRRAFQPANTDPRRPIVEVDKP